MVPVDFDSWPEEAKQEYYTAMIQMGHSPRMGRRVKIPEDFDTWPEEAKQEYYTAMRQMGHSPFKGRRSATRSGRKSGTRSGRNSATRSGPNAETGEVGLRQSKTRSGRKSPLKNRTWKEYIYENKGKAAALASVISIVAYYIAIGTNPLALPATLAANYGPAVAKTFTDNSSFIMSKVYGAGSSIANVASSALGYGQKLFGYGQQAVQAVQATQLGLSGAQTLYQAGNQAAEGLGGDEIDTAKLMGAVGLASTGFNNITNAQSALYNQKSTYDTQQKNSLIADCTAIKARNPYGPYSPDDNAKIIACDAMKQQLILGAKLLQKQQREAANSPYAMLTTGNVGQAQLNSFGHPATGTVQGAYQVG